MSTTATTAPTASRTNLGPLTTSFTYPESCTVVVLGCETCNSGWQAQTCSDNSFNDQGVQDNAECWPSRGQSVSTGVALNGWGFYSPGIQCPVGYATSCVATGTVEGGFPFQFPLIPDETAVGCCPTGYHCSFNPGVDRAQTCYSIVTTGSFAAVECASGKSNAFNYLDIPATITETESDSTDAVTISTFTVLAPLFQLNFKSSDLTNTGSITLASGATTSSTSAPEQVSSSSGELSTGAKAGIGVGAGVGAIALISTALFFFLRRKSAGGVPAEEPKPELMGGQYHYTAELPSSPAAYELPESSSTQHR